MAKTNGNTVAAPAAIETKLESPASVITLIHECITWVDDLIVLVRVRINDPAKWTESRETAAKLLARKRILGAEKFLVEVEKRRAALRTVPNMTEEIIESSLLVMLGQPPEASCVVLDQSECDEPEKALAIAQISREVFEKTWADSTRENKKALILPACMGTTSSAPAE